ARHPRRARLRPHRRRRRLPVRGARRAVVDGGDRAGAAAVVTALEQQLSDIVGVDHVLTDPAMTASYDVDWTGRFRGRARCVVRPADTDAVAAVVRACAAEGVPLCLQGGNTGLVGGSVPVDGAVLLSLTRLNALDPVD